MSGSPPKRKGPGHRWSCRGCGMSGGTGWFDIELRGRRGGIVATVSHLAGKAMVASRRGDRPSVENDAVDVEPPRVDPCEATALVKHTASLRGAEGRAELDD